MIYLLDTHLLLWWLAGDRQLPKKAEALLRDKTATFFVSAASVWEIAIKRATGKLTMKADIEHVLAVNRFTTLAIHAGHAVAAGALPLHHQDPFDRMLIAQSQLEGLRLLTHDRRLTVYGDFVQLV